jgi:hypothetical protein
MPPPVSGGAMFELGSQPTTVIWQYKGSHANNFEKSRKIHIFDYTTSG